MTYNQNNQIREKTLEFSLKLMDLTDVLEEQRRYVFAGQLLKSGTSIGANVSESQNAESVADFIHKMKIAAKEAEETSYWLELCKRRKGFPYSEELHLELNEIRKILNKIIGSSKRTLLEKRNNIVEKPKM